MNTLKRQDAATPPHDKSTRLIPLTQDKFAIIDAADMHLVDQWNWSASRRKNRKGIRWYAVRGTSVKGKGVRIYMHREIMAASSTAEIDHRNGDGLDNRRSNLRVATRQQNTRNAGLRSNNTSGYKGVWWSRVSGKWACGITINARNIHLGLFLSKREAARAYDVAAANCFGEFARPNFPENKS